MNKRYMDFVPKNKKPVAKKVAVEKPIPIKEEVVVSETVIEENDILDDATLDEFFAVDNNPRHRNEPDFGVIEEYKPKFVKAEVKKRPLGAKPATVDATSVKAQKIASRPFVKPAAPKASPEKKPEAPVKPAKEEVLNVPKTRFVNTEKVEKRPLSKNVYKKKIVAPKEEPSGPVTIIAKPDKGSHIGVIVTIVLTIVLGAAAGTVAFLLLPK